MTYNPSFGSGFRFQLGNGHFVSVWDAYTAYIFFSGKWDLHSTMTTGVSFNLNFIVIFYKKEKASKMLSLFFLRLSSCLQANWLNNSFVSKRKFFLLIISACHSESESWRQFPTNNCLLSLICKWELTVTYQ